MSTTSNALSFWALVESLPPDTNWNEFRLALEKRLQQGTQDAPTLTIPENRLLVGLRLREQFSASPSYAQLEKTDPLWWTAILDGVGARRAQYP